MSAQGEWGHPVPFDTEPTTEMCSWGWVVVLEFPHAGDRLAVSESEGVRAVSWWTTGNGGCDCNRAAALGLGDWPCGHLIELHSIWRGRTQVWP